MYIGLISDTHKAFPDDVKQFLQPVDVIWHAGDFGDLATAEAIRTFKPTIGVYGNIDGQDLRKIFPPFQFFDCEGLKVIITHIGLKRGSYWAYNPGRLLYDNYALALIQKYRPDIFICGHTHIPQVLQDRQNQLLFMNPGACGYEGSHDVPRMALRFHIDDKKIHDLEKIEFIRPALAGQK